MGLLSIALVVFIAVVGLLAVMTLLAKMFQKAGPDEALIVYGMGGSNVVTGGGRIVWPLIQQCKRISLALMSFDIAPTNDLYTTQGVAVQVEAVSQIKIIDDTESIKTASIQFLTKTADERETMIKQVMEGHLRGIIGILTVEQIVKEPDMVQSKMLATCQSDLAKMGLEVRSFTIKNVKDRNGYIENMGKPEIARVLKEAEIAQATALKETETAKSASMRDAAIAKTEAAKETVAAQTASEAEQAKNIKELNLRKAQYDAEVETARAVKENAFNLRNAELKQNLTEQEWKVNEIERQGQVKVAQFEIERKQKELQANVIKPAEANAEAIKIENAAKAEAQKTVGQSEADVIRAKGKADADTIQARADAFAQYSQAAILDKLLTGLPALAEKIAAPLANVDKITVVSTGGDNKVGLGKITNDITDMMAQMPASVEALTGMKISDLLKNLGVMKNNNVNNVQNLDQE